MPIPLVTRILIADDFAVVRSGLRRLLDAKPDLEVVAEAADGHEAVEIALKEDIHLAILDVSMPRMTGIQAAAELHKRKPEIRLLMLSMHDSEQFLFEALKAGASGYVLKSGADTDIVEISSGFVTLPVDDLLRLTKAVGKAGLKPKPEVGIQFGAGGASSIEALEAEGTRDIGQAIELAKRHLDAGAHMLMIESEGIYANGAPTSSPRSCPSLGSSRSCSRRPTRTSSPGTSRTTASTSTCSSTTARSSSSSVCAPASGAPPACGAGW